MAIQEIIFYLILALGIIIFLKLDKRFNLINRILIMVVITLVILLVFLFLSAIIGIVIIILFVIILIAFIEESKFKFKKLRRK